MKTKQHISSRLRSLGLFAGVVACSMFSLQASPAEADRLDDMISPIINPVNFEDPRIRSEIRPLFMYHEIDEDFVTQGGDVQLYALQARFAISDDFAIIATKDGFIDFNPDAVLPSETGFANVALGAKYALFQDGDAGQIVTAALRYEIPMGNRDVLQGNGDGFFHPSLSAAYALGDINVMFGTGFRFPADGDDSTFYDADIHFSTELGDSGIFPVVEFGAIHVLDAGRRLPIADEGQDLFSFGSSASNGKTIVSGSVGARYRMNDEVDFGLGYQFPINGGSGTRILDWRVTADMIYSFDL
ncbi:hypothetical protein MRY87_12750 [bacterium]|nr:hypothetical protein [bacterium]